MEIHRVYRLAVHGDHGHVEAGNANVEEGHGAGVDEAQADAFAGFESAGPVVGGALPVHQVGIGVAGHVRQVALAHAHAVPHVPVLERFDHPFVAKIAQRVEYGAFIEIVVMAEFFQCGVNMLRIFIAPVREQNHFVTVRVITRFGVCGRFAWVNHDGAINSGLFLKAGMAVIPVGATLFHGKAIGKGFAGGDAIEGQSRHAVHLEGQQNAVPVYGAGFRQQVGHLEGDGVTFFPAQGRAGNAAINGGGRAGLTGDIDVGSAQRQVKSITGEGRGAGMALAGQ